MTVPTSSARASVWEWTQAALLAANLAWTTLCLGGYRPQEMLVSAPLTFALLAAHLLSRAIAHAGSVAPRAHPAGFFLLPFLAYAAGNVFWVTPVPWLGWADWLGWAQMLAVFWLALNAPAAPGPRRLVFATVVAVGVVGVGMACWQRFAEPAWLMLGLTQGKYLLGRASGPFGIPNSFAAMLLLLIPPALAFGLERTATRTQRSCAAALAGVFFTGLVLTISRGAWLALGFALAGWPLIAWGRTWTWRLVMAGVLAAGALTVGLALYAALPGVKTRVDQMVADGGERSRPILWLGALELWADAPLLGTGAGSYNILFDRHRPENFQDEPRWAHNDYLNTLSDYGAVGFALFFGACAALAVCARRAASRAREANAKADADATLPRGWESPTVTRALGVGLIAFALATLVDFHLKIPALAMLAALVAGELVRRVWPAVSQAERPARWRRVAAALAGLAVAWLGFALVLPHYQAEALRYGVRREQGRLLAADTPDEEKIRRVLADVPATLTQATQLDPRNAQAWSDLAHVLELQALHGLAPTGRSARLAEHAARRALALADAVPEFWARLGVALDLQGRWLEAGECFARATGLAPNSFFIRFFEADHLALRPEGRVRARVTVAICLRLDPGNRSAEALTHWLSQHP